MANDRMWQALGVAVLNRLRIRGLLVVLLTGGGARPFPPDPSLQPSQYVLDNWQIPEGLPQTSVQAIARTPDGYLWIGTQEGLARFDGVRFVVFDRSNEIAIHDNTITVLHVDRAGRLWIGTQDGMAVLENGRFKPYNAVAALAHVTILSILEDHTRRLWVGT